MKLNEHTAVVTPKVLLVPYEAHHVPTYHEWMKSEELQELTASEPLSIKAEYEMQKSWREDTNKLTFIVCCQSSLGPTARRGHDTVLAGDCDKPQYMIGDVNLFLSVDYEEDANGEEVTTKPYIRGEIELMIAEPKDRGMGHGFATLLAFLKYIKQHQEEILGLYIGDQANLGCYGTEIHLGVKIGEDNKTSRKLFQSVGFEQVGEANYFKEVEFRLLDWSKVEEVAGWREVRYVGEEGIVAEGNEHYNLAA